MSTFDVFTDGQVAALILSSLVAAGVWVAVYLFAMRRLPEHQTENETMLYVYSAAAGCSIGVDLGIIVPSLSIGPLIDVEFLVLGLGILSIVCITRAAQLHHQSHVSFLGDTSAALDVDSQEEREFARGEGELGLVEIAETAGARHIRWYYKLIAALLFVGASLSTIVEGVLLLANIRDVPAYGLVLSFWVLKIVKAFYLASFSVFAGLHRKQGRSKIKAPYYVACAVSTVSVLCSFIPLLMGKDQAWALEFVENPVVGCIYALFGGASLATAFIFIFAEIKSVTTPEVIVSLVCLVTGFVATWAVGLWL